jgi:hypothetical protein
VIVEVPLALPVTMPVDAPTLALPLLLVQVPPGIGWLRVAVKLMHTVEGPVMAAGAEFTVTSADTEQPVPNV